MPQDTVTVAVTYTRAEIREKLSEWMVAEFGHPRNEITDPDRRDQWYRDYGVIDRFLAEHFPES